MPKKKAAAKKPAPKKVKPQTAPPPVAAATPGELAVIDLASIHPSPLNPRKTFDDVATAELAESIAANGVLQNLVVRRRPVGGFEIVAGERRYRALTVLADSSRWDRRAALIPVRIVDGDDATVRAIALLENLQRLDVPPMEEAEAFAALHAIDAALWSTAAIAARIGKTQRYVQQRLALTQKLDDKVKDALRAGEIDLTHARALTVADPKVQRDALDKIKAGFGGYVDADRLSDAMMGKLPLVSKAPFPVERYTGEIVEGPKPYGARDGRRFLDVEQFKALQKVVVEQKRLALVGKWAWVEIKRGDSYRAEPNYGNYRKSSDKTKAGAIVFIEANGGVVVKTGLIKVERETRGSGGEDWNARYARESKERQARKAAEQRFLDALRPHVVADPSLALRLILVHFLGADILEDGRMGDSAGPTPLTRRFRDVLDGVLEQDDPTGNCRLRDDAAPAAVLDALLRLEAGGDAGQLLAALVAEHLSVPYDGLSPILAHVAIQLGVAIPEHLGGAADPEDTEIDLAGDTPQEAAQ